jgi:hypothetical protein
MPTVRRMAVLRRHALLRGLLAPVGTSPPALPGLRAPNAYEHAAWSTLRRMLDPARPFVRCHRGHGLRLSVVTLGN